VLRGVRAAMGLSRSALAKSISVKERQVREWEEGAGGRGASKNEDGAAATLLPFSTQHTVLHLHQAAWKA
jgi:DNA-binding transcriptional regulator YiaG